MSETKGEWLWISSLMQYPGWLNWRDVEFNLHHTKLLQAYVNMLTNGSNRRLFAPDALRDLAPAEKLGAEPAAYVKLDGLGKIAYSSIKRPRPLMDLIAAPVKAGVRTNISQSGPQAGRGGGVC